MKKIKVGIACLSVITLSFSCAEEHIDTAPLEIGDPGVEVSTPTTKSTAEMGLVNVEQQRKLRNNNKKKD